MTKVNTQTVNNYAIPIQTPPVHYGASVPATKAKAVFGQVLEKAQRAPVRITKQDRTVGYIVAPDDFEYMQGEVARRELLKTMKEAQRQAKANGLTQKKLNEILAEKN
jgi:PHD/YefM family antitoxin component YafN of YafNO toxin-antitoxin module